MSRTLSFVLFSKVFLVIFQGCQCQFLGKLFLDQFLNSSRSLEASSGCNHETKAVDMKFDEENEFLNCIPQTMQLQNLKNPKQYIRTNQIIVKYGYFLKTYSNVQTKDGYLLNIFRITGSPKSPPKKGKRAVLLVHGMASSSDAWLMQSGNKNLAFYLADAGYDVWLPNLRGSDLSRGHVKLNANINAEAYWDFSFQEMGIYDLPLILELILNQTGNEKIFCVCHSMGCGAFAVALSEMPELNDKIEATFMLSPAIFIGHSSSPIKILAGLLEIRPIYLRLLKIFTRGRIESGTILNILHSSFCTPTAFRCGMCEIELFYLFGYDAPQINFSDIPNIVAKLYNAVSMTTLEHLGQNWRSCMFRKRDFGYEKNVKLYGQPKPPSYNISNIKVPTYIYYGDSDTFLPPEDAKTTRDALPRNTVKGFFRVEWKFFNHMDFLTAKDADKLVYSNIRNILQTYVNSNSTLIK